LNTLNRPIFEARRHIKIERYRRCRCDATYDSKAKGDLLPDFYSGATGLPGRFKP
jgi:hypothetical protein